MTSWGRDKRPFFGGAYPYEVTTTVYLPDGVDPQSVDGGSLESRGLALLGQIEGYRRQAGLPSLSTHYTAPDGTYFEYGFIMGKPFVRVWPTSDDAGVIMRPLFISVPVSEQFPYGYVDPAKPKLLGWYWDRYRNQAPPPPALVPGFATAASLDAEMLPQHPGTLTWYSKDVLLDGHPLVLSWRGPANRYSYGSGYSDSVWLNGAATKVLGLTDDLPILSAGLRRTDGKLRLFVITAAGVHTGYIKRGEVKTSVELLHQPAIENFIQPLYINQACTEAAGIVVLRNDTDTNNYLAAASINLDTGELSVVSEKPTYSHGVNEIEIYVESASHSPHQAHLDYEITHAYPAGTYGGSHYYDLTRTYKTTNDYGSYKNVPLAVDYDSADNIVVVRYDSIRKHTRTNTRSATASSNILIVVDTVPNDGGVARGLSPGSFTQTNSYNGSSSHVITEELELSFRIFTANGTLFSRDANQTFDSYSSAGSTTQSSTYTDSWTAVDEAGNTAYYGGRKQNYSNELSITSDPQITRSRGDRIDRETGYKVSCLGGDLRNDELVIAYRYNKTPYVDFDMTVDSTFEQTSPTEGDGHPDFTGVVTYTYTERTSRSNAKAKTLHIQDTLDAVDITGFIDSEISQEDPSITETQNTVYLPSSGGLFFPPGGHNIYNVPDDVDPEEILLQLPPEGATSNCTVSVAFSPYADQKLGYLGVVSPEFYSGPSSASYRESVSAFLTPDKVSAPAYAPGPHSILAAAVFIGPCEVPK
jgi:hypothetical protein